MHIEPIHCGGAQDGVCGGALVERDSDDDLESGSVNSAEEKSGQAPPEVYRDELSSPAGSSAVQVPTFYALRVFGWRHAAQRQCRRGAEIVLYFL